MSDSQVADMVTEDGKTGVGKLDKLLTNTFHRHLLVMIVLSFAILSSFIVSQLHNIKSILLCERNV